MSKRNSNKKLITKIINIIIWIVLLYLLYYAYGFYQKNNFNDFIRSESNLKYSKFERDNKIKYSNKRSYKITSETYNDAMFYKKIKVEKNSPYKVTCMVKTNNVVSKNNLSGSGAQISIEDTTERSIAITGTHEWQKIELLFNSKNREEVNIGFRLGGYIDDCSGEAWFSDFTIEEGFLDTSKEWKFACFIFENTDVNINGNNVKLSMVPNDISDIKQTITRFENSCREMSNNKMTANCDIYNIQEPITKLSYDDEFGYFVAPEDVEAQIKDTINSNDYDHIFVIIRLGNEEHNKDIQINDWIGLGAMDYYGIGFSNIRLPNSSQSYIYKYDSRINTFPEEVLIHEFLHSLERTLEEYDYKIPALHDNEKYGYKTQKLTGLKYWYIDYMNKSIKTTSENIGLYPEVYTLKPAKNSNFEYSYKLNEFTEPENIIEEIRQIFKNLVNNLKQMKQMGQVQNVS